ncbi:purine-binding chemotaxis protein CheW [Rhizomicrobium palustre]|uniref:Purine-binding chemotaxis protein CheW n=1 Tax=Rhizomicrobium palustre TaxID=189966 RepID=A0A846N2C2_9PROT|nr:chemotaxis protein CheW [Rhizomicrobium palustre]NIK89635.1 purine-binding chemotaxis protein CheW [Rhizomicrobium palustre]
MSEVEAGTDSPMEVVTFDMQGETFAIEASLVREIVDHMQETVVPGAPAMVAGLANFRGRVIPLADLHREFGFDIARQTADSRVIVIELDLDGETTLIGIKADKVHEVTLLEAVNSEAPPRVGMRWQADLIRCIAKRDNDFIIVPNLERIFALGCDMAIAQN